MEANPGNGIRTSSFGLDHLIRSGGIFLFHNFPFQFTFQASWSKKSD